jgi:nucleoside 2-deoxyribosyltransferase
VKIYIIGSLRNPAIPDFANTLAKEGYEVFADWFAPGPEADDFWRNYSKARGWTYKQALNSHAAKHVFEFDKHHLDEADVVVMLMPAGKSGHLELGYQIGKGKLGYILFDQEPERYDVMVQFATDIFFNQDELLAELRRINERAYVGPSVPDPSEDNCPF